MPDSIETLNARYRELEAADLVAAAISSEFPGRLALVSSFGAESVVLLHLVSKADPATPVIFLDTGKHFGETLRYRDRLVEHLGLVDVRSVRPLPDNEQTLDPKGTLWQSDPDRCCYFRKVLPLQRALEGFDAWITGRKRYHGESRTTMSRFELAEGRIKLNPLADWDQAQIDDYIAAHDLPLHPLTADGFQSIGCMPCTDRSAAGDDARSGRWPGSEKTECGIHMPLAAPHERPIAARNVGLAVEPAAGGERNIFAVDHKVDRTERAADNGHRGGVLWLTGLSASGKSTIAMALERHLFDLGWQVFTLDGDNLRHGLSGDLGFSPPDRAENIRRAAEAAGLMAEAGTLVIATFISPLRADRQMARDIVGWDFHEVFVDADLDVCEARDPKGLYARARAGEIPEFTGVSAPYEAPLNAEVTLDTVATSVGEGVSRLAAYIGRALVHDWVRIDDVG